MMYKTIWHGGADDEYNIQHTTYSILPCLPERQVTLCGENVYPQPALHPDRILNEHDLLFIQSGTWSLVQDDAIYHLQSGDLVFLRSGSHHQGLTQCSRNARTMFIHMTCLPSDRPCVELSPVQAASYRRSDSPFCLPTLIHCENATAVTSLFRDIIDTYWSQRNDNERRLRLLLNLMLNDLTEYALSAQKIGDEWSVMLIRMFSQNPKHMYSVKEVAVITGMNERTLSSRFRTITGESIHKFQLNMKLDEAYRILRDGGVSVKEASEHFGFCDAYHFSHAFKQKFGVSPKELKSRDPRKNINLVPPDR